MSDYKKRINEKDRETFLHFGSKVDHSDDLLLVQVQGQRSRLI